MIRRTSVGRLWSGTAREKSTSGSMPRCGLRRSSACTADE